MKKTLFLLSLLMITAWLAAICLGKVSGFGHSLLLVGILFYLRSMMVVETPAADEPKLEGNKLNS